MKSEQQVLNEEGGQGHYLAGAHIYLGGKIPNKSTGPCPRPSDVTSSSWIIHQELTNDRMMFLESYTNPYLIENIGPDHQMSRRKVPGSHMGWQHTTKALAEHFILFRKRIYGYDLKHLFIRVTSALLTF